MLRRDLRAADRKPLESRLLDQRARVIARRTLERTAGARHLERLFRLAPRREVRHLFLDGLAFPALQGERDLADGLAVRLKYAVAIAEIERGGLPLPAVSLRRHRAHGSDDVLHLTVIGAGVHEDRAADAARDAAGELEPRETGRGGCRRYILEQSACARDNALPLDADRRHRMVEFHDSAADALIEHEHIRAVAEDRQRDAVARDETQDTRRLIDTCRKDQIVGFPADLERRMLTHGRVQHHLLRPQETTQLAHECFIDLTHVHPPQICSPGPASAS